jgi:hypothetical protein
MCVSIAVLALVLVMGVAISTVGAQPVATVDDDHALNSTEKMQEFAENGVAETDITIPQMKVRVSDDHQDVGLDGFRRDTGLTYLKIDYNEEIPREVRIYIPEAYWSPVENLGKKPVNGGPTADLEITRGGTMQSVSVEFSGETEVVYAVSSLSGAAFAYVEAPQDRFGDLTGVNFSVVADEQEWQYPPEGALTDGSLGYGIKSGSKDNGVLVQYNDGGDDWVPAPDCRRHNVASPPVCKMVRKGVNDKVYVVPRVKEPPQIRYKQEPNTVDKIGQALDDLGSIPGKITELIFG